MPNRKGQSHKKDSEMISWIQFQSGWSKTKRNKEISKIEKFIEAAYTARSVNKADCVVP